MRGRVGEREGTVDGEAAHSAPLRKMTNRVLWLLSYIGLSLALALGNRQTSATEGAPRAVGAAEARPRGLGHNWLVYDKRAGPEAGMLPADRVLLIDDVLSTVNSYLRQQQRHHQELEAAQRNRNAAAAAAGYLYDEDEDELDDELAAAEDEEELQQPRRPAGRTFAAPAALYAEGLARPRPGSSARGLPYQASPPPPAPPAAPPSEKPPGKRNQQAAKEAQQQAAAAATAAGASMASQFLRSARGNRNFDVPQIGKSSFSSVHTYYCLSSCLCFALRDVCFKN